MPRKPKRHPGGRPTVYDPDFARIQQRMLMLGASDSEIADSIGVHRDTLFAWRAKYPEFSDSTRKGRALADAKTAHSLFRRANGYSHRATKIAINSAGEVTTVPYTERYPPDTAAAIFWLCNRRPQDWQHVQKIEHAGTVNLAHWDLSRLTPTELEAMRALAKKAAPELEAAGDVIEVEEEAREATDDEAK